MPWARLTELGDFRMRSARRGLNAVVPLGKRSQVAMLNLDEFLVLGIVLQYRWTK
jgi:hypothetical protein